MPTAYPRRGLMINLPIASKVYISFLFCQYHKKFFCCVLQLSHKLMINLPIASKVYISFLLNVLDMLIYNLLLREDP